LKILIVGGAGRIGTAFCHYMKDKGRKDEIYVLDPNVRRVPIFQALKCGFIRGTVLKTCLDRSNLIKNFDVIVNMPGGLSEKRGGLGWEFNEQALSTKYLKDAHPDAQLVHISTFHVYREPNKQKEVCIPKPISDFGLALYIAEISAKEGVVLRFGDVWGGNWISDREHWDRIGWADNVCEMLEVRFPKTITCLLHIKNAVRAIEWAIENPDPRIYNVADFVGTREDAAKAILPEGTPINLLNHDPIISVGMNTDRLRKAGFEYDSEYYVF